MQHEAGASDLDGGELGLSADVVVVDERLAALERHDVPIAALVFVLSTNLTFTIHTTIIKYIKFQPFRSVVEEIMRSEENF